MSKNQMLIKNLLLFQILILGVNTSFLIFPLKSKKKNNIDLPFEDSRIMQYYPSQFDYYNYINDWYKKAVYTELSMGSSNVKIITELDQRAYDLKLEYEDKYQEKINVNYFASSYSYQNTSTLDVNYYNNLINIRGSGKDKGHLTFLNDLSKKNTFTKDIDLDFSIAISAPDKKINDSSQIIINQLNKTFDFAFGILIANEYRTNKTNIIQTLKAGDYIDSYDFTLEFYKNPVIDYNSDIDEVGRLIFGKFEQLYNTDKYPVENVKITKLQPEATFILYKIYLSEIFMQNSDKSSNPGKTFAIQQYQECEFKFDENLILGTREYRDIIKKEFFDVYKNGRDFYCEEKFPIFVNRDGTKTTYDMFECKKDILNYKNEFPVLKFYQFDFDYTFEFGFDELFREINGKLYFMVAFTAYSDNIWTFGKLFLKKYQIFFNLDAKVAKFYNSNNNTPKTGKKKSEFWTAVKISFEIVLIVVIAAGAYYLGRKINRRRKIKAVELEENEDIYMSIKEPPKQKMEMH